MDNPIEVINYRDYTVKIYQDIDPMNPVEEFDSLGTMVCFHNHKRYTLGHKQYNNGRDALYDILTDTSTKYCCESIHDDYNDLDDTTFTLKYSKILQKLAMVLPLYLLDHSGLSISTTSFGDPWDSWQEGFIYVLKDKVRAEYNWKLITAKRKELVLGYLENEVKTYDQYLCGDIYGYVIKNFDDDDIDSCWGFFGHNFKKNGMQDEWEGAIDYHINEINIQNASIYAKEIGDMDQLICQ